MAMGREDDGPGDVVAPRQLYAFDPFHVGRYSTGAPETRMAASELASSPIYHTAQDH